MATISSNLASSSLARKDFTINTERVSVDKDPNIINPNRLRSLKTIEGSDYPPHNVSFVPKFRFLEIQCSVTVAWLCCHDYEVSACRAQLDEEYRPLSPHLQHEKKPIKALGRIGEHFVTISSSKGYVPRGGLHPDRAKALLSDFPSIRFGVYIGTGFLVRGRKASDIKAGDVVVSLPQGKHGGFVEFYRRKTSSPKEIGVPVYLRRPPPKLTNLMLRFQHKYNTLLPIPDTQDKADSPDQKLRDELSSAFINTERLMPRLPASILPSLEHRISQLLMNKDEKLMHLDGDSREIFAGFLDDIKDSASRRELDLHQDLSILLHILYSRAAKVFSRAEHVQESVSRINQLVAIFLGFIISILTSDSNPNIKESAIDRLRALQTKLESKPGARSKLSNHKVCIHGQRSKCKLCSEEKHMVLERLDWTGQPELCPRIFHGIICTVERSSKAFDEISRHQEELRQDGVLCVDAEASGFRTTFPSFVLRGITNFDILGDTAKGERRPVKERGAHAAATCAREFLLMASADDLKTMDLADTVMRGDRKGIFESEREDLDWRIPSSIHMEISRLMEKGTYSEIEAQLGQTIDLLSSRRREVHPDTLAIVEKWLSALKHSDGHQLEKKQPQVSKFTPQTLRKLHKAETIYYDVLETEMATLGLSHPNTSNTLRAMSNLADMFREEGSLERAEELYRLILDGHEAKMGENCVDALRAKSDLARALGDHALITRSRHQLQAMVTLYTQVLTAYQSNMSEIDQGALREMDDLLNAMLSQRVFNKVEPLYEHFLAAYESAGLGTERQTASLTKERQTHSLREQHKRSSSVSKQAHNPDSETSEINPDADDARKEIFDLELLRILRVSYQVRTILKDQDITIWDEFEGSSETNDLTSYQNAQQEPADVDLDIIVNKTSSRQVDDLIKNEMANTPKMLGDDNYQDGSDAEEDKVHAELNVEEIADSAIEQTTTISPISKLESIQRHGGRYISDNIDSFFRPTGSDITPSFVDHIKCALERWLGSHVAWWPLKAPQREVRPGYIRMYWNCNNRQEQWMDISTKSAILDRTIVTLPSSTSNASPQLPLPVYSPAGSGPASGSSALQPSQQFSGPNARFGPAGAANVAVTQALSSRATKLYLLWCADKMVEITELESLQMCKQSTTDKMLVRSLRDSHRAIRGIRWWFSLKDLAKVNCIQFRRLKTRRGVFRTKPTSLIPDPGDQNYDYSPISDMSEEEYILYLEKQLTAYLVDGCDSDVVDMIERVPKRLDELRNEAGVMGYGIYGLDGWSVWRFLIAFCITQPIPVAFAVWWLYHHPSDVQGAFTPEALLLGALALFVVLPDCMIG